jgi:hypothetical protein
LWDTSTSNILGVIQDNVSTDGAAVVASVGRVRASCILSVSAGGLVTPDTATGQIKEHGLVAASIAVQVIGIALQNGSTNSVIDIMMIPNLIVNG